MKFNTLTRRAAAAGALTALTASGLVAATTVAANAAPVTNTYTCATSIFGDQNVILESDAPGIEGYDGLLAAGQAAPAGALPVDTTFTITDAFHDGLVTYGIEDLAVPDFAGTFGNATVPVTGITAKVSEMTDNGDGTWTGIGTQGVNSAFTAPSGGDHAVVAPSAFHIDTTVGGSPVSVPCAVQGSPGSYATLTVVKNASTLKASCPNSPVPHGKKAILKAKVKAPNHTPTGKVLFKDGTKKLGTDTLNARGVAVLKAKLSKGKHKIKMIYKGDGYTTKSSGTVKVTQK